MPDTVYFPGRVRGDTMVFSDPGRHDLDSVKDISRVTWVGVLINVFLAAVKSVLGVMASSSALVADAVHTISDLATDVVILVGVRLWSRPADADHPYGHRKIETLITLGIGLLLAAVGCGMGYRAVKDLAAGIVGGGEALAGGVGLATWLAFSAALVSLVSKELLYRWTAAEGVKLESAALVANAWHHRSDALSSIPPALSIGGSALGARLGYNLWYLDPVGTLVVCVMLLQAAWEIMYPTLAALLDASADRRLCSAIREAVLETPGVLDTYKIRTRCLGSSAVAVDLHISVRGTLSVREGHDIATAVWKRVMRVEVEKCHRPVDVMVHVEPAEYNDALPPARRESDTMQDWKARTKRRKRGPKKGGMGKRR